MAGSLVLHINWGRPHFKFHLTARRLLEAQLYRQKVREAVLAELNVQPSEEQVWARHILVPDELMAELVIQRLEAGEDFTALAAELSTDTGNKDKGGDLGWFGHGKMVVEFEEAAFALEIGEISGPVSTTFGYHIIQVLGHEERPLSQFEYDDLKERKFTKWLTELKTNSTLEIYDYWTERVPVEPTLPPEIENFIQQVLQQQSAQQVVSTTPPVESPTEQC